MESKQKQNSSRPKTFTKSYFTGVVASIALVAAFFGGVVAFNSIQGGDEIAQAAPLQSQPVPTRSSLALLLPSSSVLTPITSPNPSSLYDTNRILLLDSQSIQFSPSGVDTLKFGNANLIIQVYKAPSLANGATCQIKAKEYPTKTNPTPTFNLEAQATYNGSAAQFEFSSDKQILPNWDFDIRCKNPDNIGENSNTIYGVNKSYSFKIGAISTTSIEAVIK